MIKTLLDVFFELRKRRLQLGIPEFMLLLETLAEGFGSGSREDFIFMLQTIWAKNQEECQEIAFTVEAMLPAKLADERIAAISEQAERLAGSDALGGMTDDASPTTHAKSSPVEQEQALPKTDSRIKDEPDRKR